MSKKQYTNIIWQFKWSKWSIYLTAFLTPLCASMSHWYPFTTPKMLLIIGGTLVAVIFFTWGLIESREEAIKITSLHYIFFGFLLIMVFGGVFGIDPNASFFGTFFSSVSIVLLLILGVLACLVSEFARRDFSFVKNLLIATFISGVAIAFITYLPLLGSHWKLLELGGGSLIGNSSFAGTFLLFAIGFGGYLMLIAEGWKKKLVYALGIISILACPIFFNADFWRGVVSLSDILHSPLLASGEAQGAQLGVVVLTLTTFSLWLVISRKKITKIIGVAFFVLCMAGITIGYVGLLNPNSPIHQHFAEAKTSTRFVFWDISKQAIVKKPLLGYGFENYQKVYQQHFDPIVFTTGYAHEQWVSNPHNIVYDMAVSSGILGLLGYMILLGGLCVVFIYFVRNKEDPKERWMIIFPGLLLGYLVQNFFVFDAPTGFLVYFICIGLAMGCLASMKPKNNISPQKNLTARKSVGFAAIIIFAVCFVVFVILPWHESRQWAKLLSLPISEERIALQGRVQKMSPMGGVDADVLYALNTLNALDEVRAGLKPEDKQVFLKEVDSLIAILEKDNKKYSDNFYASYLTGTLMHLAYAVDPTRGISYLDQARTYFDQARLISPLNPRLYFSLAQNALFRKDGKSAIGFIRAGMALGLKDEGEAFLKRIQK